MVRDATGVKAIPRVTVQVASPALIEKTREVVADSGGLYKFTELPLGTYTVTFTAAGFKKVVNPGIELSVGFTATVNARMAVGSPSETVVVTGQTSTVDTQGTQASSSMGAAERQAIPMGGTAAAATGMTTGATGTATNQDVGGTQGENAQGFRARGSTTADYHQLRDGMMYGTLVAAGNYMSSTNPAEIQNVQTVTSGSSAENWTGGGYINNVPKNGGNVTHGSIIYDQSSAKLQGNNVTPALVARGVTEPPKIKSMYEIAGGIGGAIKKNKLWYFANARRLFTQLTIAGIFFNTNQALAFPNNMYFNPDQARPGYNDNHYNGEGLRVTWQASKRNKIMLNHIQEQNCNCFYNINQGKTAPEATGNDKYIPNWRLQASWSFPVNKKLLLWAGMTEVAGSVDRTGTGDLGVISVQNTSASNFVYESAGTGTGFTTSYGTQTFTQINGNFTASYVTGKHAFKFGFSELFGKLDRLFDIYNKGVAYQFACAALPATATYAINPANNLPNTLLPTLVNGMPCTSTTAPYLLPSKITQWLLPYEYHLTLNQHVIFAQDQWRVKRKLTVNFGVRGQFFRGRAPAQSFGASPTFGLPARSFAAESGLVGFNDLDPRMGAAYDLKGNGRTVLKVSFARSVTFEPLGGYSTLQNPAVRIATNTNRAWTDNNGNYLPDCDLTKAAAQGPAVAPPNTSIDNCGLVASGVFYTGGNAVNNLYDKDVTGGWFNRQYNWQLAGSVTRVIVRGVTLTVDYYRTWFGNLSGIQQILGPTQTAITTRDGTVVQPGQVLPTSAYDNYRITVPNDARLPNAGTVINGLYDLQTSPTTFFGKTVSVVRHSSNFAGGPYTDVYTGMDALVSARWKGLNLSGGVNAGHEVTQFCAQANSPQDLNFQDYIASTLEYYNNNYDSSLAGSLVPCAINPPWYQNLQFRVRGIYTIPKAKVRVSISEQNLPSIPFVASYQFTSATGNAFSYLAGGRTGALSSTTRTVQLITPQALYQEGRNNQLDLSVGRPIKFKEKYTLDPSLDFFNLFNAHSVLATLNGYNTTTPGKTGAWQNVATLLVSRIIKWNLKLNF